MTEIIRFKRRMSTAGRDWGSDRLPDPADTKVNFTTGTRRFFGIVLDEIIPLLVFLNCGDVVAYFVVAFVVWNSIWLQGRTGASLGKKALGLQLAYVPENLVKDDVWSFVVPGVGRCALRFAAHIFDYILFIGFFKALLNIHGQSFADKLAKTIVLWDPHVGLETANEYRLRRRRH